MTQTIETGEIHFFYRAQLDVDKPSGVDDLQRMYLALVPDDRNYARLFVVGRKKLPEIIPGEADPSERHWMLLTDVGDPSEVGKALHPVQYETKTRGDRRTPQAIPVGSGRYVIASHDDTTQLAYRLLSPERRGESQKALNIEREARYVLSVKNPSLNVEGFPEEQPDYPEDLSEKFADERWIDVSDPRLLDYENAQLLLIGAADETGPLEIKSNGKVDPFATFHLNQDAWPEGVPKGGDFAEATGEAKAFGSESDRTKGGKRGGLAASDTDSAAGVASSLKGVSFPADRAGLLRQAKDNGAPEEVVALIKNIPDHQFDAMSDVMEAIGEVR